MESGEWIVDSGEWKVENGEWIVENEGILGGIKIYFGVEAIFRSSVR